MDYTQIGFDKTLYRNATGVTVPSLGDGVSSNMSVLSDGAITSDSSTIPSPISDSTPASSIVAGSIDQILYSKKTSFTDTSNGWRQGLDKDGTYKWIIGGANNSVDWNVTTPNVLTVKGSITATSGTIGGWAIGATTITGGNVTLDSAGNIRFGKTDFTDTVNAGLIMGLNGVTPTFYFGTANDGSYMKLSGGVYDLVGTISGRSTLTISTSINASGNLITDIINGRIDSSAKAILSDFNFGSSNYAGAVNAGNVTWNTSTGAITGGSGILIYRSGIVGVSSGVATFTIDTSGNATFAGTLSAATGTLGALTVNGAITVSTGGNIHSGQSAYNTGTGWWLEYNGGTPRFSIGNSSTSNNLTWDGSSLSGQGNFITTGSFTAGENLSTGNALAMGNGQSYADVISQTSQNTATTNNPNSTPRFAQTFTTGNVFQKISSVILKLSNGAGNNWGASVTIRATSSHLPTGSDLATSTSNTVNTTPPTDYTFTFTGGFALSPNTEYAIVVNQMAVLGADNNQLYYQNSNVYSGGQMCSSADGGTTWSAFGTSDMYFHIAAIQTVAGQVYKTNASSQSDLSDNFIGFCVAGVSAAASVRVNIIGIDANQSGLSQGVIYYLSNTAGSISSSAGTVSRKAGLAVSTTSILKYTYPF